MTFAYKSLEDAIEEIIEATQLMTIAYKKLIAVSKEHQEVSAFLRDSIINLDTSKLSLVLVQSDFEEKLNSVEIIS